MCATNPGICISSKVSYKSTERKNTKKNWIFLNVYVLFFFNLIFGASSMHGSEAVMAWNVLHNLKEPWPDHDPLDPLIGLDFCVSLANASKQRVRCCKKCSQMKPPRCHHRSVCGKCIEEGPSLFLGLWIVLGLWTTNISFFFLVLHMSWNKPCDFIITTTFCSILYWGRNTWNTLHPGPRFYMATPAHHQQNLPTTISYPF